MKRFFIAATILGFAWFLWGEGKTTYFVSDPGGIAYEEISKGKSAEFEYVLVSVAKPNGEVKTLLNKDKELKRWEIDLWPSSKKKEERIFERGILAEKSVMAASGLVERVEFYDGGNLASSMEYVYTKARLSKSMTKGPTGELRWTDTYLYSMNGSLRETRRTYADGEVKNAIYMMMGSRLGSEWIGNSTEGSFQLYDEAGRKVKREEWRKSSLLSWEQFMYRDRAAKLPESSISYDEKTKMKTLKAFDLSGRIVSEKIYSGDVFKETLGYGYSDTQLTLKTRTAKGLSESWTYSYDSEGALRREEYIKNGTVEKITGFDSKDAYTEELYRNGTMFAKNYYVDRRKIREEIYGNGKLLRARNLN